MCYVNARRRSWKSANFCEISSSAKRSVVCGGDLTVVEEMMKVCVCMYVYVCGGEQEVERTVDDPQQVSIA